MLNNVWMSGRPGRRLGKTAYFERYSRFDPTAAAVGQNQLNFLPFCPRRVFMRAAGGVKEETPTPETTVLSEAKSVPARSKGPL